MFKIAAALAATMAVAAPALAANDYPAAQI